MPPILRYLLCFTFISTPPGLSSVAVATEAPEHLVATMPKHFPPIYTVSRNNVPTGYGVAFMELVAEHTNLNITYKSAASWPHAFQMISEGEADIIPSLGITPERINEFAFTQPYDEFQLSIFVKKTTRGINSLNDLGGSRIGVVDTNRGQSLLADMPDIAQVTYANLGQLVAALTAGEVDAVVYPAIIFEHFTATLGIQDSFKQAGPPLETIQRAIAVRKELSHLIPLLNRGIEEVLASHTHSRTYARWHPQQPSYWNTRRVLLLTAALGTFFVIIWLAYGYIMTRKFNKALIEYSNLNHAILNATSDGIITVDSNYRIVTINTFAETLFAATQSQLCGKPISQLLPGNEVSYLFDRLINSNPGTGINESFSSNYSLETLALRSDKKTFPVRIGLARMDTADSTNVVCTVHDESRAHEAENRADQLIKHDPLTGVTNQRGLLEILSAATDNNAERIYCFCIGLTHMTQINSLYGRHVGDNTLVRVANELSLAFVHSKQTQICRSSGNHFIVTVINPETTLEDITKTIISTIKGLQITTTKSTSPLTIDIALGAAVLPDHADKPFELINNAEIAYAAAKRHAFDNFSLYAPELKIEQSEVETSYQRVKSALAADRVVLYYQPIQTVHSQQTHHYEALVRMHDEDGTLIMPAEIIPVAEKFNIVTQIDYKVMKLALEQLVLLNVNHPDIAISVNLSAKHIGDENLYELIQADMCRHNIDYANLIFEITETAALQNFAAAREFMNKLIRFGCRFALDDFGVGFTSFAQLRTLPVDIIKIDGMFIKELHTNSQDQVFVKAMTEVAHSLGKKVVAEFVENEDILKLLNQFDVDYAQGYHIGRPDPVIPLQSSTTRAASGKG